MIDKDHRFRGHHSVLRALKRGRVIRGQHCSLKFTTPSRPGKNWRAAVVVSRKVHKSAVVRNRIRRRIYEQIRLNSNLLSPGVDYVFITHSDRLASMPASELIETIVSQLSQTAPEINQS